MYQRAGRCFVPVPVEALNTAYWQVTAIRAPYGATV